MLCFFSYSECRDKRLEGWVQKADSPPRQVRYFYITKPATFHKKETISPPEEELKREGGGYNGKKRPQKTRAQNTVRARPTIDQFLSKRQCINGAGGGGSNPDGGA